jgi:hypothetical protein
LSAAKKAKQNKAKTLVSMGLNLFLSAAKKVEQNKAKTLASMGLKTHFARVAIKTHFRLSSH